MADDPLVSVIIPAYNAQATVAAAIEAVTAQRCTGGVELVVVDDGSTDATGDIVRRYPGVRYIRQDNAGPASARNRGAGEARGAFLFFTDADCRPQPGWVARMMQGFGCDDVAAVSGSYGIVNPGSWLARIIHAEIRYRHTRLMPRHPFFFGSYNVAVRHDVFRRAGGFNAVYRRASGEDNDLSYRIVAAGGRILFMADACVDHYHQESLGRYLREQFRHGFWRVKMYLDHPQMMAGDGYTFWKDIVEVPCVLGHGLLWWGWPWPWPWPLPAAGLFFLFEVFFGSMLMRSFGPGAAAGGVMWLRAFARTAGFIAGGVFFLKKIFLMPKKI